MLRAFWGEIVKDSNEVQVLALLEALRIYSGSFHECLNVESDSSNALRITFHENSITILNEIRAFSSSIQVVFEHVNCSANALADSSS